MILSVVTPASQIITTEEAKKHLNVNGISQDGYIDSLVQAATVALENYTEGQLGVATYELLIDGFKDLCLEKHPVSAISSITYFDSSNVQQTLAVSFYDLFTGEQKSRLIFDNPPDTYDRIDAVTITYVAGYSSIPTPLLHAVKLTLGSFYSKRDDSVRKMPTAAEYLAAPYKRMYS